MKKRLLLTLLTSLLLAAPAALADEIVISQGSETSLQVPFSLINTSEPQRSQVIYPAAMLQSIPVGSAIKSLTFYGESEGWYASTAAGTGNVSNINARFTVRMLCTTQSTYATATYIEQGLTTVFNGTLSIIDNEVEVQLDDEFVYVGGNLMLDFSTSSTGDLTTTYLEWLGVDARHASIYESYGDMEYDDFRPQLKIVYGTPATCRKPVAVQVASHDTTSAVISWQTRGTEKLWDLRYTEAGGARAVVTGLTDSTYTITGLTPDRVYSVEVRAVCSADDRSEWTAPVRFDTYIYCKPDCRVQMPELMNITYVGLANGDSVISSYTHPDGNDGYGCYTDQVADLYLGTQPVMDILTTGLTPIVYIDMNRDLDFTPDEVVAVYDYSTMSDGMWMHVPLTLPDTLAPGNYRLRLFSAQYYEINGMHYSGYDDHLDTMHLDFCNGAFTHSFAEDYTVRVLAAPSCLPPLNPRAVLRDNSTALFRWTEADSAQEWAVRYSADMGATWTVITGLTVDSAVITGLAAETEYWFEAQARCSATDSSRWSLPAKVYTGYCRPYLPSNSGYDVLRLAFGSGTHEVNRTDHPVSGSRYMNNYTDTADIYREVPQHITITHRRYFYSEYYIMLDIDHNGSFDADEMIYGAQSTVSNGQEVLTFTLPDSVATGTYRMRVAGQYVYFHGQQFSPDYSPCEDNVKAFAEDYTVCVLERPSCLPPSGLSVTMTSETSARLSWTAGDAERKWQIDYSDDGGTVWHSINNVTATTYSLTGLATRTTYRARVRALCSSEDASPWTPEAVFFTGYCEPDITSGLYGTGVTLVRFGKGDHVVDSRVHPDEPPYYQNRTTDTADVEVDAPAFMQLRFDAERDVFYAVYVDLNHDLSFGNDEVLGMGLVYAEDMPANQTLDIRVPAGTPLGEHRLRLVLSHGYIFDNYNYYCSWYSRDMVVEDYTLRVLRNVGVDEAQADGDAPQLDAYVREGHLVVESVDAGSVISLYDAAGRCLITRTADGRVDIALPSRGIYMLTVRTRDGVRSAKVVY